MTEVKGTFLDLEGRVVRLAGGIEQRVALKSLAGGLVANIDAEALTLGSAGSALLAGQTHWMKTVTVLMGHSDLAVRRVTGTVAFSRTGFGQLFLPAMVVADVLKRNLSSTWTVVAIHVDERIGYVSELQGFDGIK